VVIESDHVVILGASERLPVVVEQLVIAHRKIGGRSIVVMADRDPSDMVDEVGAVVEDSFGSRIVYRSGDSSRRRDLELVRLQTARTVIVLAGDDDVGVVRTVLAIGAELGGFDRVPIVAEVTDLAVAEKLARACGPMIHPILASQASARTAAFALREPGMSQVVDELFDFRKCDLYVHDDAALTGRRFGDVVRSYLQARPIGLVRSSGEIELNPSASTEFETGDRLAVLAQDRGPLEIDPDVTPMPNAPSPRSPAATNTVRPEHLLVLGWSGFGTELLSHWADYANEASSVEITVDPARRAEVASEIAALGVSDSCTVIADGPMDRLLHPAARPDIDTVVFLGDHRLGRTEADVHVLLDLAVLRAEYPGDVTPRFVVELRDAHSLPLVDLPQADDYVVSDATASKFIAQLAEQPERRRVFLELYDPTSSTLRIDDADELGLVGEFLVRDLWSAAYDMGLIAIGWRRAAELGGEFVLNAPVTDRVELRGGDQLVSVG
jgi:Trk K+ transport system NAD-binding subunit